MAYDDDLAERVREVLVARGLPLDERKMFGGLAFMVDSSMAVAIGTDGMLVRCAPDRRDALMSEGADEARMGQRIMRGWVEVDDVQLASDDRLAYWVGVGCDHVRELHQSDD